MFSDLRWEYKALAIIAIIATLVTLYSYSSFNHGERVRLSDSTQIQPQPQPVPVSVPNMTDNRTNTTENVTAEEARQIAAESGYTAGQPTRGSINLNGTDVEVWVVPLQRGGRTVKEVYVSMEGGQIVGSRELT
ncbi:hypothetical protein [Methanothermobacter sp. K4]|uniref:hypothetical protein n=1 Tax=Methanothermobacter sp. K4 TaxID=2913262 RepID=UPI001EDBD08D|nr:hypothetical protein [Methanothermobacter sp. K4]MCG2828434.1 hypothetical protein [Methanothermobacter sp. K4]